MAITNESRHELYERLREVLGHNEASTLMEHLPPVGWADVATKRDLDAQSVLLKRDLDAQSVLLKRDLDAQSVLLKRDIEEFSESLRGGMQHLDESLRGEMQHLDESLRGEVRASIAEATNRLTHTFISWLLVSQATMGAAIIAAVRLTA